MSRKSEGTVMLEVDHLRKDNQRLTKLLAQTKEYKNFGEFAKDSGEGIRYMDKNLKENIKVQKLDEEQEDWIPDEAFKVAHEFRNKHAGQISTSLINDFLKDLNKIWRKRE